MRMTIFNELRWREIQQQGHADGRDIRMIGDEITELREEREQYFTEMKETGEENERLQRENEDLHTERDDLFGKSEDLHSENTALSNRLSDLMEDQDEVLREQNEREDVISTLRLQLAEAVQDQNRAVVDGARLSGELDEVRGLWDQTIRENTDLTMARDQAVKERDALQADLMTEIVMLSNQHTDLHDIVSTLRMQLTDATQEIGRLRCTIDAMELKEMLS